MLSVNDIKEEIASLKNVLPLCETLPTQKQYVEERIKELEELASTIEQED